MAPPVTRYQSSSSRRSTKGRLARGMGWFLLFVLVVGAGIGGGAYLYYNESLNAVKAHTHAVTEAEKLLKVLGNPNQPAIALVAGYDHRAGTGTTSYAGSNSDTLMLLRADPKKKTLSLLSFPRDLNVPIYCKGNTVWGNARINSAWVDCGGNGGPRAVVDTIEHLTRMKVIPNFLITLDFHAFQEVVDKLGGVYLNVDRRYYIPLHTGTSAINLHPGYQKLNGTLALQYVRFRHFDSDIYRNGRQQLFMEALKARIKSQLSLSNIGSILGIVGALKGNLEIAKADGSAVNYDEMKSYLGLLVSLPAGHLVRNSIPLADIQYVDIGGASEVAASPQAIAGAVQRFLHPVVPKVRKTKHHHSGGGKKTPSIPPANISVLVLNGGNITGEAANTSYLLGRRGFTMNKLTNGQANAPKKTRDTIVYYDPSQNNGLKAANELAALFGSHTRVAQMTQRIAGFAQRANGPLTVVAIGTSYTGKLKAGHRISGGRGSGSRGPSTANAQVTDGTSLTLSAVRSKNGKAHFQLMVPHKVAVGSSISTEEGVRLFKPAPGKREFVLTFNLNNGVEYWQVEESDWTAEPLLASPTKTFFYRGLKYAEFTSGGTIQEIAVYSGHSVYWVQNTILNSLSNPTMVAIAESLRPLH